MKHTLKVLAASEYRKYAEQLMSAVDEEHIETLKDFMSALSDESDSIAEELEVPPEELEQALVEMLKDTIRDVFKLQQELERVTDQFGMAEKQDLHTMDENDIEELIGQIGIDDFSKHDSYSGRGMFGKNSKFAFTTSTSPNSAKGKKLVKLGFTTDNIGMDFIYYLK